MSRLASGDRPGRGSGGSGGGTADQETCDMLPATFGTFALLVVSPDSFSPLTCTQIRDSNFSLTSGHPVINLGA